MDPWSSDEVHFQQYGSRCRMWVPPEETDPVLWHHPTRRSMGYFAAVRLRDGKFLYLRERGLFNGESFWKFLRHFRRQACRSARKVILITDNAGYHHAGVHRDWRENYSHELVLDFLPPYSPELNPIERVWKLTRRLCLHNHYFPTLEAVAESVETQFNHWHCPNNSLRRLCAIT